MSGAEDEVPLHEIQYCAVSRVCLRLLVSSNARTMQLHHCHDANIPDSPNHCIDSENPDCDLFGSHPFEERRAGSGSTACVWSCAKSANPYLGRRARTMQFCSEQSRCCKWTCPKRRMASSEQIEGGDARPKHRLM